MKRWFVLRLLFILVILSLSLTGCQSKAPAAPAGEQPAAPAATEAAPAQPAQPAAAQPAQPAAPAAPAGDQIALANGKTVARPTTAVTADNAKRLDALNMWQLSGQINQVLFSPDGMTAYAAVGTPLTSAKGELYRWRLDDPKGPQLLVETQGSINSLLFSPDNKYLIYGTQGNELVMYDLAADKAGPNLLQAGRGVTAVAYHPSDALLTWASFEDYAYYLYMNSSKTGQYGYRLGTTLGLAFSTDGKEVFMAREDGSLFIVDTSGWQLLKSIAVGKKEPLSWIQLSPNGNQVAVSGSNQGILWVVDAASFEPVVTLVTGAGLNKGAFSPDGQMLLVGNNNNSLTVVNLPRKDFDRSVKLSDSAILSVAISPDGAMVLIGDRSGQVRLLAPEGLINPAALPPTAVP